MRDGIDVEGIVLKKDTHAIEMMNEQENVVSVSKRDIVEIISFNPLRAPTRRTPERLLAR